MTFIPNTCIQWKQKPCYTYVYISWQSIISEAVAAKTTPLKGVALFLRRGCMSYQVSHVELSNLRTSKLRYILLHMTECRTRLTLDPRPSWRRPQSWQTANSVREVPRLRNTLLQKICPAGARHWCSSAWGLRAQVLKMKITWVDQFVALVAVDQAATKRSPIDHFELLPVLIPIKSENHRKPS